MAPIVASIRASTPIVFAETDSEKKEDTHQQKSQVKSNMDNETLNDSRSFQGTRITFKRSRNEAEKNGYNEEETLFGANKSSIAGPSPPSFFSILRMLSFAEFTFTATDLLRYITLGITVLILLVYLFPAYALISLLLALAFCLMLVCVCINRIRAEVGRKRVQPSKLQQLRNELYSSKRNN